MLYIASVRDKETKEVKVIEREYETKKAFREDLLCNGYSVRFIATEETFDEECEKYHNRVQLQISISKAVSKGRTEAAHRCNMTVKEYERKYLSL